MIMSELWNVKSLPSDLNQQVLTAICQQLVKDFALCDWEFDEGLSNIDEVKSDVYNKVSHTMECNAENYFSSLYRLDIPDHITKDTFQKEDPVAAFTELILLRAYQKVRLREIYKSLN